jgi:hypothetical protein
MMGLAWATAWVPIGVFGGRLVAGEVEPEHIGGPLYAGLLCGSVFSAVAGIASARRWLGELSLWRAGAWGAVSGAVVGVLPFVIGDQHAPEGPLWVLPVQVSGALSLLSAVSAVASTWVARRLLGTPVKGVKIES